MRPPDSAAPTPVDDTARRLRALPRRTHVFRVLGMGLAALVSALSPLPASVAPWSIGLAILLGVGVGLAAGVYPSARAARLDPIVALRAE